jgi:hypothetical protein
MTTDLISHPVTHVALTIAKPLLIVLAPMSAQNAWWTERKGLLSLRNNGLIIWHSDHAISDNPYGEAMTDIRNGFKRVFQHGWEIYLGEADHHWYELSFLDCEYSADQIRIPVYPSAFTLGNN